MLNERIENLKLDMAQRTDTRGDAFQIDLEKPVVKDRAIAGELFSRITRRVANANNQFEIGAFAGFQLFARPSLWGKVELVLNGKNHYALNVAETPLGMIRSLEYLAQNLEERLTYNQRIWPTRKKNAANWKPKSASPLSMNPNCNPSSQRQQELEDALDITKNQAANSLSDGGSGADGGRRSGGCPKSCPAIARQNCDAKKHRQNARGMWRIEFSPAGNYSSRCIWQTSEQRPRIISVNAI